MAKENGWSWREKNGMYFQSKQDLIPLSLSCLWNPWKKQLTCWQITESRVQYNFKHCYISSQGFR
jgi:hypothetical protein